jgi:hypothetical protein
MNEFTKEESLIILEALNFFLKNQQDALFASKKITPIADKVQNLIKEIENK